MWAAWVGCTSVTDDRRQTDGQAIACEFTFAKNCQRQSCSAINCLSSGINILAGGIAPFPWYLHAKGPTPIESVTKNHKVWALCTPGQWNMEASVFGPPYTLCGMIICKQLIKWNFSEAYIYRPVWTRDISVMSVPLGFRSIAGCFFIAEWYDQFYYCNIYNSGKIPLLQSYVYYGRPIGLGRPLYFTAVVSISSFFVFPRLFSAVGDWMCIVLPHMMWP